MLKKAIVSGACLLFLFSATAQLNVTVNNVALNLAKTIAGPGVSVSNAVLTASSGSVGTFSGNTNIGIDSGVVLTTGLAINSIGPNNATESYDCGTNGDADLANLMNRPVSALFDAAALEFDITTPLDSISFNYVFASEEYPEFVCSLFADAMGIFISGPGITGLKNIAVVPGTNAPISINTINSGQRGVFAHEDSCAPITYPQYFVADYYDSEGSHMAPYDSLPYYTQYSGFSTILTASMTGLVPCATYHVKFVISDVGDPTDDSGVFLQSGNGIMGSNTVVSGAPYTSDSISVTAVAGCSTGYIPVYRPYPSDSITVAHFIIGGTAQNGIDYTQIADSLTFGIGDSVSRILISPLASGYVGIKTVMLYFASACGYTDSITINIASNFGVLVSPHVDTICRGRSLNLLATSISDIYSWSPSAGLSDSVIGDPVANPLVPTIYICTSFLGSCTAADSVRVNIFPVCPLGINETLSGADEFEIFPNPAMNIVIVRLNSISFEHYDLFLTDVTGQILQRMNDLSSGQIELNLNNIAAGVYVITVRSNNGIASRQLVKF